MYGHRTCKRDFFGYKYHSVVIIRNYSPDEVALRDVECICNKLKSIIILFITPRNYGQGYIFCQKKFLVFLFFPLFPENGVIVARRKLGHRSVQNLESVPPSQTTHTHEPWSTFSFINVWTRVAATPPWNSSCQPFQSCRGKSIENLLKTRECEKNGGRRSCVRLMVLYTSALLLPSQTIKEEGKL